MYAIIFIVLMLVLFALNPEMLMTIGMLILFLAIWIVVSMAKDKKKEKNGTKFNYSNGSLLMTLYTNVSDRYKFKELKVYRRGDGSTYYTQDDGYRHEGTPGIFATEVKTLSSGGMDVRTGLGRIEAGGVKIERVELSADAQKIHGDDPLYKQYVRFGQIACEKNVQYSDATLSAYSKMNYRQQTQFAGLHAYDYQLDYKDCQKIQTLLRRILDGVTPEQAAKQEKRGKTITIVFWTIVGILVLAYWLWYNFY